MFDSDYVRPDENDRVMQDSHPTKKATWNQALKRFEDDLKNQGQSHVKDIETHFVKIKKDTEEQRIEKEVRLKKQQMLKVELDEQL